ncbi:MAG: hypothetical protein C4523_01185 [Myxococcales bacterium]|nr:MAG: hypothetical protein C4523_01185 [Myxococcales bacterium]
MKHARRCRVRQFLGFVICAASIAVAAPGWAQEAAPAPSPVPEAAQPAEPVAPAAETVPEAAPPAEPAPAAEEVEEIEEITDISEVTQAPSWDPQSWSDPVAFPAIDRGVNILTARTLKPLSLMLVIDHRASQPFTDNTWRDFFGLDAGSMKIGLGLRFGIVDGLDVGIYRLNGTAEPFDSYELDLRWCFLKQADHWLDMAVRGGATWFYQPDVADAAGGYGELMIDHEFFDRLLICAVAQFHSDSSWNTKTAADKDWSLAAGGVVEIRILDFLAWNAEVLAPVAGYTADYPGWSSSVKFITNKHIFSLVLANTNYINADGIVAGSDRDFSELIIGFNIIREFTF